MPRLVSDDNWKKVKTIDSSRCDMDESDSKNSKNSKKKDKGKGKAKAKRSKPHRETDAERKARVEKYRTQIAKQHQVNCQDQT
jgi:hypothetical protein